MIRAALLLGGILVLALAWLGPLPQLARRAFFAHMSMHMAVVALAAPLLALGASGAALDPARRWPRLFSPLPASLVELVVVWTWHAPSLHHAARHDRFAFAAEQSMFLLAGLLLWLSALGGGSGAIGCPRRAAGVVALLLTSMHMTALGALIALAPRPLFAHAESGHAPTPLADQHLGGAIMILAGGLTYLVGGLGLMAGILRGTAREPGSEARA